MSEAGVIVNQQNAEHRTPRAGKTTPPRFPTKQNDISTLPTCDWRKALIYQPAHGEIAEEIQATD
jgi:hypothetical protein